MPEVETPPAELYSDAFTESVAQSRHTDGLGAEPEIRTQDRSPATTKDLVQGMHPSVYGGDVTPA